MATCVTTSCMQYVLANNQVFASRLGWLASICSVPGILYMEALFPQKGTFVLQLLLRLEL